MESLSEIMKEKYKTALDFIEKRCYYIRIFRICLHTI